MPVRPVMVGSVMLTVPVSPSTLSRTPWNASRPASVTTNDGTPKRVETSPWNSPMADPATMPAAIAR